MQSHYIDKIGIIKYKQKEIKIFRSNKKRKAFDQFIEIHQQFREFIKKSLETPFQISEPEYNFQEFNGLDFVALQTKESQSNLCVSQPVYLSNHQEIKIENLIETEFVNDTNDCLWVYVSIHEYLIPPHCNFHLSEFHNWEIKGKYDLVVMDPPWSNASVARSNAYNELDHYELFKIPMRQILSDTGILVIWITNNSKYHRFVLDKLLPAYGLECTSKLVWIKVNHQGELITELDNPHRKPYEIAYICQYHLYKKELPGMISLTGMPTFHSKKPVLDMFDGERKLELFSRCCLEGWTSWGNETLKFNNTLYIENISE
ncbi:Methyltransferase-like protein 4 [Terramyces sp. JEL0728]|nr:Methyltransferase-like protein 4 [Terramyces sp. JEL0728]